VKEDARESTRTLKQALETLRVLCPTPHPVDVRRVRMADNDFGYADLVTGDKPKFKVRINRALQLDFQIWVLIHEWAHCMTWDLSHSRHDDHGAHFGVAYSEAYNAIYQ
jgi:hypothetical protein